MTWQPISFADLQEIVAAEIPDARVELRTYSKKSASHQKSGGYHPGVISVAGSGSLQFIVTAYFGITT